jgi:hypothetical protein
MFEVGAFIIIVLILLWGFNGVGDRLDELIRTLRHK